MNSALLFTDQSYNIDQFDYDLPPERIAQTPIADRDASKLLVLDRSNGEIEHRSFFDIVDYLNTGDVLVLNDTRVTAMRLYGELPDAKGKPVEIFLLARAPDQSGQQLWFALVRPGKKLLAGVRVDLGEDLWATVLDRTDDRGGRLVQVEASAGFDVDAMLENRSVAPLPPYISAQLKGDDRERYQTVYAQDGGSAAAPTAGLHFTDRLLERIATAGVKIVRVTLHVGLGTFRPIDSPDIRDHKMHSEQYSIGSDAADAINNAQGRIIAVGTTSARTLEASATGPRRVQGKTGETSLYITPGYTFNVVDALVTNFHMPRSTLLVLVSAFAGRERIRTTYEQAVAQNYRFLSFGDAMLIR